MTAYEIYCSLKKEKGVSDADVAKSTGIGKSTFSDWKSGRSKPKYEKLIKIADFFNVPYTFLIGKTEDRSKERIAHDKKILEAAAPIIKKVDAGESILNVKDIKIVEVDDNVTELSSNGMKFRIVRADSGTGKTNGVAKVIETVKNAISKETNAVELTEEEAHIISLYRSSKYKEIVSLMMDKMTERS